MAIRLLSLLLARPGGGHGRGGGGRALARPSADSLSGRLRVGFAWRGPCAALRKAACAEGASGASFGRCAPPATGGGPCRRAPAPWTGRGDGAAAPQPPLQAGAALCCLVGSLLDLCATFARLQWRGTASRGECGARHARRRAWPGRRPLWSDVVRGTTRQSNGTSASGSRISTASARLNSPNVHCMEVEAGREEEAAVRAEP